MFEGLIKICGGFATYSSDLKTINHLESGIDSARVFPLKFSFLCFPAECQYVNEKEDYTKAYVVFVVEKNGK